jgi:hypothetical protein
MGHDSRNVCVSVCLPFEGNGRAIAPNVRDTVNGRVRSVVRTPALENGGM